MSATIRPLEDEDRPWVEDFVRERWGDEIVVGHGVVFRPAALPGFLLTDGAAVGGVLTYSIDGDACEVVTIDAVAEGRGYGGLLLDAVEDAARGAGCSRLWLITTDDNERAIGFYRAHGFEVVAIREGAIERSREMKPSIPLLDGRGVPIRDEIEMERLLAPDDNLMEGGTPSMLNPTSPDPISDPKGYQTYLLGLLGDDDPAAVQARTPATLRELAGEAGPHLGLRPQPKEWSAFECMAHLTDAEIVMSGRYRWVLAHDEPPLIGYDQDLWVDRLHADDDGLDSLLDLFDALRLANVTLWQRTRGDQRQRVGIHAERGPESFDLAFRMIAGHDRFHVEQARRTLGSLQ